MNYLLLLITFYLFIKNTAFSYDNTKVRPCETCKWFKPINNREDYGLCTLFKERIYIADQERLICNFAKHCRNNELLCGKEGNMYEEKMSTVTIEEKLKEFENRYDNYIDNLNDSNIGHGEINEKQDIDRLNELDKEFYNLSKDALELFMKVKKHNKKKISIKLDSINYLVKNNKFKK
jgi:hypothetical protein